MNPLHYPDLERCKKLTEIGFPKTELYRDMQGELTHSYSGSSSSNKCAFQTSDIVRYYSCPSVMEMLDVIPKYMNDNGEKFVLTIQHQSFNGYIIDYSSVRDYLKSYKDFMLENKTLPNALADLIIWLHENKHITL